MRTLGQTAGIAVAGAIWASQVLALNGAPVTPITAAPPEALAGGFDVAMLIAAGLAALAILPSLGGWASRDATASCARTGGLAFRHYRKRHAVTLSEAKGSGIHNARRDASLRS